MSLMYHVIIGLLLVGLGALGAVVVTWVVDYERERREERLAELPDWSTEEGQAILARAKQEMTAHMPVVEPERYNPRHRRVRDTWC